jgi:hypothetical protein
MVNVELLILMTAGFKGEVLALPQLSPWHEPGTELTVLPKPVKVLVGKDGDEYKSEGCLICDVVYLGRYIRTFRRNLLLVTSEK